MLRNPLRRIRRYMQRGKVVSYMPTDTLTEEDKALIEELVNDHEKFNAFVYTESLEEAMVELERRRKDPELQKKVEEYFKDVGIPAPFQKEPRLTIFRQVATPNLEISRFLIAADGSDMKPLFLEYHEDKFTSNNEWKRYLGKIAFYNGEGKKGGSKVVYKHIIDFVESDGEKMSEIKTLWKEPFIDFHHRLFFENYFHLDEDVFFDASAWFGPKGMSAVLYYRQVLGLFIRNGILFENFLLEGSELQFTENVILPIFISVHRYFGVKPVIIPLAPTKIESSEFWMCQNHNTGAMINDIIDKHLKL